LLKPGQKICPKCKFANPVPIPKTIIDRVYYAIAHDRVISVHMKEGEGFRDTMVSELRVNGELADSHRHGWTHEEESMFATLEVEGKEISVRADVAPGVFKDKVKLLIDSVETPLVKSSDADIKALLHEEQPLRHKRF
ncbi:hypothetical protein LR013_01550, partial [candidate division NPL-UPA2 bacterium]|nr:hypothetical protein [candidate division NPL-UPA2 bacterium]